MSSISSLFDSSRFQLLELASFLVVKENISIKKTLTLPISKQLSGFSLSHLAAKKNYRLKKWSFSVVINVKQLLKRQYTKINFLKSFIEKILKSLIINIDFES